MYKHNIILVNYISVKIHMKQHQTLISLERHYTKAHTE